jgi:ubiquitin-conjugating enzyme E2 R
LLTSSSNASNSAAIRALQMELKSLQSQPIEGFKVVCDEDNLFKWTVAIFGPPGTLYQVFFILIINYFILN